MLRLLKVFHRGFIDNQIYVHVCHSTHPGCVVFRTSSKTLVNYNNCANYRIWQMNFTAIFCIIIIAVRVLRIISLTLSFCWVFSVVLFYSGYSGLYELPNKSPTKPGPKPLWRNFLRLTLRHKWYYDKPKIFWPPNSSIYDYVSLFY